MSKRILCSSDWHVPEHDKNALKKFEQAIKGQHFDHYVVLGDIVDFTSISKFVRGKPLKESQSLYNEMKDARDILERHASILRETNKDVKLHYCTGNHEYRLNEWLERHPQFLGLIDMDDPLGGKEFGYKMYRYGELLTIDKSSFTHGFYHGVNHARKTAGMVNGIIIYGHTHSLEANCVPGIGGAKSCAFTAGCLCKMDMEYLKGRPTVWEHGFVVVEGGNVYQVRI